MHAAILEETFPLKRWGEMDAFLARAYGPGYVMRSRALFEWQFAHPQKPGEAAVLCAYRGGELVGILGYMPTRLLWGGPARALTGAWMANWMVYESERRGIGWLMIRRLQERFPVVLGQGANEVNRLLVAKMGFRFFDRIPRHLAVFDARAAAAFLAEPKRAAQLERIVWRDPLRQAAASPRLLRRGFPPAEYDPDWSLYPSLHYGTLRDAAYIDCRYLRHPAFEYRVAVCGPASSAAVCVYRVARSAGAVELPVGHIVELFFPESGDGCARGRQVLAHALRGMRDAGCAFCDFYCTAPVYAAAALEAGMVVEGDPLLPHRLVPVEHRGRGQNLEAWASPEAAGVPALARFYVTKSDGDQDRPNRLAEVGETVA